MKFRFGVTSTVDRQVCLGKMKMPGRSGLLCDGLLKIIDRVVVLPVKDGPQVRLRCVARPDQAQAALLDRLGLQVPKRLRVPPKVAEM